MILTRLYWALLISLFSTSAYCETPPDWDKWRGPNGNSSVHEQDWDPGALSPEPNYVWRATVGFGYSALCIKGDYLYTMGNHEGIDTVYCLLVENAQEVWRYSYPCEPGPFAGPHATPVCSDGLVYCLSREGLLICFDAKTGKIAWQKDLAIDANADAPRWGISSSVIIKEDMLLLNVGQYGLALDKKDGSIIRLDEQSADPIVWGKYVFVSFIYSRGCGLFDISDNRPKEV